MSKPPMRGLTVRWSLVDAPPGTAEELAAYVDQTSHTRFEGMRGLRFKVWRMRPGEWFEGCYVFESDADRETFEDEFRRDAASAPGSLIVGAAPILIERCMVPALARGAADFVSASSYDA